MKEEFIKIWNVSKKSNKNSGNKSSLSYIKYTVESHASILEQIETKIQGSKTK
jgi:hypothetical protein